MSLGPLPPRVVEDARRSPFYPDPDTIRLTQGLLPMVQMPLQTPWFVAAFAAEVFPAGDEPVADLTGGGGLGALVLSNALGCPVDVYESDAGHRAAIAHNIAGTRVTLAGENCLDLQGRPCLRAGARYACAYLDPPWGRRWAPEQVAVELSLAMPQGSGGVGVPLADVVNALFAQVPVVAVKAPPNFARRFFARQLLPGARLTAHEVQARPGGRVAYHLLFIRRPRVLPAAHPPIPARAVDVFAHLQSYSEQDGLFRRFLTKVLPFSPASTVWMALVGRDNDRADPVALAEAAELARPHRAAADPARVAGRARARAETVAGAILREAGGSGVAAFLDIACGNAANAITGALGAALGLDAANIHGCDIDAAARPPEGSGYTFARHDAGVRLGYADGAFDAATCFMGLHHIFDPARALAEVFRVLRPNGVFVIREHDCAAGDPFAVFLHAVHMVYASVVGDEVPLAAAETAAAAEEAFRAGLPLVAGWYRAVPQWVALAEAAGFRHAGAIDAPRDMYRGAYAVFVKPRA